MNQQTQSINAYLLVDGALASETISRMSNEVSTDRWRHCVYVGAARLLGPLVIDIDEANQAEQLDEMMNLVNAMSPQLHLSYIETPLSAIELTRHFQQFNVIRTGDGRLFNLRLSDCVVLSMLMEVLTPAQWAALTGPLTRWSMHCRGGQTIELQGVTVDEPPLRVPLTLKENQFVRLTELGAPDVMLANIRAIRHGELLTGSRSEQHRWASEARQLWADAGNSDELVLRWLTAAAVDTKGSFLSHPGLRVLLAEGDRERIRSEMASAIPSP